MYVSVLIKSIVGDAIEYWVFPSYEYYRKSLESGLLEDLKPRHCELLSQALDMGLYYKSTDGSAND